jgi:L-lactate dehydrogenase
MPEERNIGSGTILDTARLRARIAEYYRVNQQNIHAYVLGEHGDTAVVPWSIANISNVPVEDYGKSLMNNDGFYPEFKKNEVEDFVRKSGGRVIRRKGATYYAVSMSVCHLCKCLLSGIDTSLTVSTMVHGEYGLHDVALSLVNVVGKNGIHGKIMVPLTDAEIADLHKSADSLKAVINSIEI